MLRSLFPAIMTGIFIASAQADEPRTLKSIPYAGAREADPARTLDVYAPAAGSDRPIVVWIHGGAWQIGDKQRVEQKPQTFNQRGYALVSVNYRLHPATDYKGQAGDVAQAIRWVHDHAREFGGSPDKIVLMGHSAGAHLAALVATDPRYLQQTDLALSQLKGVILLDGAGYDIPRQIEIAPLPRMKEMYKTVFSADPEKQRDASPITYAARDQGIPPFLILYVAARRDGKLQSEALGQKLTQAGVSAEVVPAENKSHRTINTEIGTEGDAPTQKIFEFLGRVNGAER